MHAINSLQVQRVLIHFIVRSFIKISIVHRLKRPHDIGRSLRRVTIKPACLYVALQQPAVPSSQIRSLTSPRALSWLSPIAMQILRIICLALHLFVVIFTSVIYGVWSHELETQISPDADLINRIMHYVQIGLQVITVVSVTLPSTRGKEAN